MSSLSMAPADQSVISVSPPPRVPVDSSNAPLADQAKEPTSSSLPETSTAPSATDIVVHVELICGGITNVEAPVCIAPRYDRLPLAGGAKAFDRQFDGWLTRALDLGMIGSGLGQLFPINSAKRRAAGKVKVDMLLLAGMGEPGRFAPDDLRFLMSNITIAVKVMGHNQLSTGLIGTRRNELSIEDAVHGFLEGITDGFDRTSAIVHELPAGEQSVQNTVYQPLHVLLVETDRAKSEKIQEAFERIRDEGSIPQMRLEVTRGQDAPGDRVPDPNADYAESEVPVTWLRVTKTPLGAPAPTTADDRDSIEILQFSALSEVAAITVRETEVSPYFMRELPSAMAAASTQEDQADLGNFFTNYLIPDDFEILTANAPNLTFVVDETTAAYPWEMAAHSRHARTSYVGTSAGVSRQFHTVLSEAPGSPPPLNKTLNVLLIADPAPGRLSLPGARNEGYCVIEALKAGRLAWKGRYDIKLTVRIGSHANSIQDPLIEKLREQSDFIVSAGPCDPLDIAMLVVNEHYDVIHYAGHGFFNQRTGRAGWILGPDCYLAAQEIFRVRQIPRLVFANACYSAGISETRTRLVGLAQAFIARGIPNFIGTGWQVDDACARECARWFYARVLGLSRPAEGGEVSTLPPATIGEALLKARVKTFELNRESTTWGAYQHYGRVSDRLLSLPNFH